jgi:hypothetical protein
MDVPQFGSSVACGHTFGLFLISNMNKVGVTIHAGIQVFTSLGQMQKHNHWLVM